MFRKFLMMLICLNLLACSFTDVAAAEAEKPFSSTGFNLMRNIDEYRLARFDVIDINIIGLADIPGLNAIRIGADGFVSLPFCGFVKLQGLTLREATDLLMGKLGKYYMIPDMTIMVKDYGPRHVYVAGEVKNQGMYTLPLDKMNIFSAITSAGGITKRGRPKHIILVRSVNGEILMREVNLDRLIKQQDVQQNILLQDGDMVYVPDSGKIILAEDIVPIFTTIVLTENAVK